MPVQCPFCHAATTPLRDARGLLVCPLCHNTGDPAPARRPVAAPVPPVAPVAPVHTRAPAAPPVRGHQMQCPFCQMPVTPLRDATGRLLCPACRNTGRPRPPAASAALEGAELAAGAAGAAAAVPARDGRGPLALMLGVSAFAAMLFGIMLGTLVHGAFAPVGSGVGLLLAGGAVALGFMARRPAARRADASGARYGTAAVAVGLAWMAILGTALGSAAYAALTDVDHMVEKTVAIPGGQRYLHGFEVEPADAVLTYEVDPHEGVVFTGVYTVADAGSPRPTGASQWRSPGATDETVRVETAIPQGTYALSVECRTVEPCTVTISLDVRGP